MDFYAGILSGLEDKMVWYFKMAMDMVRALSVCFGLCRWISIPKNEAGSTWCRYVLVGQSSEMYKGRASDPFLQCKNIMLGTLKLVHQFGGFSVSNRIG